MQRIVLTFGLLSGAILAAMFALTLPLVVDGTIGFENGQLVGYTSMVLAFVLVFFGIRSYRENIGGGVITFGRAFKVGILITLITCAVYVATWLVIYYNFTPDFLDRYEAFSLEKMRAEGASEAQILAAQAQMATFKRLYRNPLFNAAITFLEVFPVGLIMTLVSAAILRKKTVAPAAIAATA